MHSWKLPGNLLFMPDLFSYFLTGVANNEYCIASTSELLNAKSRNWSFDTIHSLGLPEHLFGKIILPGTIRGTLKEDIARETGLGTVDVIAVGSHDTASAVAAVPAAEVPSLSLVPAPGRYWELKWTNPY